MNLAGPETDGDLRSQIVRNALWAIREARGIHYSQSRPIDGIDAARTTPLWIDCSGFVTLCYSWTQDPRAPDPNGREFSGVGYTGTIHSFCHEVAANDALPGDLVLFGPNSGEHLAILVDVTPDPLVATHGDDRGPILIRLSALSATQRPPTRVLRVPGMPTA